MDADDVALQFGDESAYAASQHRLRHPIAVCCHLAFRALAIVVYMFCGWFSDGFIGSFVTIVLLLSMDFWTVKNVTGRLLVGLRWWNYIDEEGVSHWIYESRKETEKHLINAAESRIFWTALYVCPLLWSIFFFITLFGFKLKWFMVVCIGLVLNGANLYGYIKCKIGKKQAISAAATNFFQQQLFKNVVASMAKPQPSPLPTRTV